MFALTALLVFLFDGEKRIRMARAGLYGIFASQTNDIAIGLPIIQSIYPPFVCYLLLSAIPQLAIVNAIGFAMLARGMRENDAVNAVLSSCFYI